MCLLTHIPSEGHDTDIFLLVPNKLSGQGQLTCTLTWGFHIGHRDWLGVCAVGN